MKPVRVHGHKQWQLERARARRATCFRKIVIFLYFFYRYSFRCNYDRRENLKHFPRYLRSKRTRNRPETTALASPDEYISSTDFPGTNVVAVAFCLFVALRNDDDNEHEKMMINLIMYTIYFYQKWNQPRIDTWTRAFVCTQNSLTHKHISGMKFCTNARTQCDTLKIFRMP